MTIADGPGALALEIGKALSIAVVDYGGFVVLVERMDGARPMTPSIAAAVGAGVEQREQAPARGDGCPLLLGNQI